MNYRAAVELAKATYPNLDKNGLVDPAKRHWSEKPYNHHPFDPNDEHEAKAFNLSKEYLSSWTPLKGFSKKRGSYGIKHQVERAYSDKYGGNHHVANGILILAAMALGIEFKPDGFSNINVHFKAKP